MRDAGGREKLLAAARNLFPRSSYAEVGVAQLLEEAGVKAPTLYYHFGDKEGLFVAHVEQELGSLGAHLRLLAQTHNSLQAALADLASALSEFTAVDLEGALEAGRKMRKPSHQERIQESYVRNVFEPIASLLQSALQADFDPSFSMEMVLDHGSLTPLELAGVDPDLPIVPILINCVQPPMPTMRRSYALGRFLGEALRAYDRVERIAVLATGGISHDIATPRMGMVNEDFDQTFLRLLESGDTEAVLTYATDFVHTAGNGCEEIRMWMAAMGIAQGAPFRRTYYKAVNDWYTGIGIGRFEV